MTMPEYIQKMTSTEYIEYLQHHDPARLDYFVKYLPIAIRKINVILDNLDELQNTNHHVVVLGESRLVIKPKEDGLCYAADITFGTLKYKLISEWPEYNPEYSPVYPVGGQNEYGTRPQDELNLWLNPRRISLARYMKASMENVLSTIDTLRKRDKI
uniref:Uncharacterized protein n=1 Tax=Acinetobacter phage vB_AbaSt_W16 TaxID=3116434 RepID=A0AB38ZCR0_9CAUD